MTKTSEELKSVNYKINAILRKPIEGKKLNKKISGDTETYHLEMSKEDMIELLRSTLTKLKISKRCISILKNQIADLEEENKRLQKKSDKFEEELSMGSERENEEDQYIMLTSKLSDDQEQSLICNLPWMSGVIIKDVDLIRVRNFVQKML